jgi:hypothetical protein
MECGSNYARSMAAYSLLLAYSGFSYNMTKLEMGFDPIRPGKYFWSLDKAWGVFEQDEKSCALKVLYGEQRLGRLRLGNIATGVKTRLGDSEPPFALEGTSLVFEEPITIKEGQSLVIE